MEDLLNALKKLQANAVAMYAQSHGYHWNVEGIMFKELHAFFLEIYEDVFDSIDTYSEWMRKLDGYAPFGAMAWGSNASILINDSLDLQPRTMIEELIKTNTALIENLNEVFNLANVKYNQQGLANFLAERIDQHQFWGWQLKASLKKAVI
jgi:starvation-inducible DNA-binding protein